MTVVMFRWHILLLLLRSHYGFVIVHNAKSQKVRGGRSSSELCETTKETWLGKNNTDVSSSPKLSIQGPPRSDVSTAASFAALAKEWATRNGDSDSSPPKVLPTPIYEPNLSDLERQARDYATMTQKRGLPLTNKPSTQSHLPTTTTNSHDSMQNLAKEWAARNSEKKETLSNSFREWKVTKSFFDLIPKTADQSKLFVTEEVKDPVLLTRVSSKMVDMNAWKPDQSKLFAMTEVKDPLLLKRVSDKMVDTNPWKPDQSKLFLMKEVQDPLLLKRVSDKMVDTNPWQPDQSKLLVVEEVTNPFLLARVSNSMVDANPWKPDQSTLFVLDEVKDPILLNRVSGKMVNRNPWGQKKEVQELTLKLLRAIRADSASSEANKEQFSSSKIGSVVNVESQENFKNVLKANESNGKIVIFGGVVATVLATAAAFGLSIMTPQAETTSSFSATPMEPAIEHVESTVNNEDDLSGYMYIDDMLLYEQQEVNDEIK